MPNTQQNPSAARTKRLTRCPTLDRWPRTRANGKRSTQTPLRGARKLRTLQSKSISRQPMSVHATRSRATTPATWRGRSRARVPAWCSVVGSVFSVCVSVGRPIAVDSRVWSMRRFPAPGTNLLPRVQRNMKWQGQNGTASILLMGPPGSGKTTVRPLLAEQLRYVCLYHFLYHERADLTAATANRSLTSTMIGWSRSGSRAWVRA